MTAVWVRVQAISDEDLEIMRAFLETSDVRGGDRWPRPTLGRGKKSQRGDARLRAWGPSV